MTSKALNHYQATVLAPGPRQGVLKLSIGGTTVAARAWPGPKAGSKVSFRIRPEEVLLAVGAPGRLSAQNVLAGKVLKLGRVPEGVYVRVDVGFVLHSLVTPRSIEAFGLKVGQEVRAVFKVMAVEPLPAANAPLAVVLRGKEGPLRAEHMELLRQVHGTGSLSAAARSLGVSYRSAWLWAQALNKAFERPLLVSVQGGAKGGGCVLSSEARAWLRAAEALEWGQKPL